MWVVLHWSRLNIVGVSMVGQLAVVAFTFSPYVALVYLPVLMISGLVTGLLAGYVCRLMIRATAKSNLFKSRARELARWEGAFCKMAFVGGLGLAGLADCGTSAAVQSGDAQAEPVKASTFAFNTLVNITAYGVGADVVASCIEDCARYEDLFSARKEGTEVTRINEAAGEPVEVSADTADLIAAGLEYGRQTDGAFDIIIGSVGLLWDFINAVKPGDEEISEGLKHIDYAQVVLDGTTVTPGTTSWVSWTRWPSAWTTCRV